jgi:kynurenine formamidase
MARFKRRPSGSNWGDFGPDDQRGRLNLLTPQRRKIGLSHAVEGITFTLSLPLDYPGGSAMMPYRRPPHFHVVEREGRPNYNFPLKTLSGAFTDIVCDDAVTLYTQYSTQWDSLAHIGGLFDADGDGVAEYVYYNGFRACQDVVGPADGEGGAKALGIENMAMAGVQGCGVMVDLFRAFGRERVRVGYDALMRCMEDQRVSVETGDFLCLRTGLSDLILAMNKKPDPKRLHNACAALDGRDEKLLQWIDDSGLVAICADNFAVEAWPTAKATTPQFAAYPLHEHCLFKLGIHLGELWYLSELADWLHARGRSRFLLTAPPLRLPGSVGSPVTPIATV